MPSNSSATSAPCTPFLKWTGGKRWLANAINAFHDMDTRRHVEPFAGSAACFFASTMSRALLTDTNSDLINAYRIVRDEPLRLIARLSSMTKSRDAFLSIRQSQPRSPVSQAARFIYLNRTAFNGLYRVNREGQFNVPYGCKPNTLVCDAANILAASARLHNTIVCTQDFEVTLADATRSDLVYIDPPYTVKHDSNCFRRYNDRIFSWSDQVRLSEVLKNLASHERRLIVTNAHHDSVLRLYPRRLFLAFVVRRPSNMAADISRRGKCCELLLMSRGLGYSSRTSLSLLRDHLSHDVTLARRS